MNEHSWIYKHKKRNFWNIAASPSYHILSCHYRQYISARHKNNLQQWHRQLLSMLTSFPLFIYLLFFFLLFPNKNVSQKEKNKTTKRVKSQNNVKEQFQNISEELNKRKLSLLRINEYTGGWQIKTNCLRVPGHLSIVTRIPNLFWIIIFFLFFVLFGKRN